MSPLKIERAQFRHCNVQTKDDAESRDEVCFRLKPFQTGTDGEKVVRVSSVLCADEKFVLTSKVERRNGDLVKSP